jgi:heme exporter protein A
LHAGQYLHLQGPNGVGKTSLLRMVCGLAPVAQGELRWRGQPLAHPESTYRSERLYLGHQLALKDELSALENLMFDAAIAGQALSREQAMQALQAQGLASRAHLPLRVLSQGQKRRCALARLAPGRTTLWVLDEPFVALDAASIEHLRGQMGQHLALGGAVLYTSHQAVTLDAQGRSYRLQP